MFYDDRNGQLEQNGRAEQWQCEQVAGLQSKQRVRGLNELLTLEQGGVGYVQIAVIQLCRVRHIAVTTSLGRSAISGGRAVVSATVRVRRPVCIREPWPLLGKSLYYPYCQ
jgi:hypothetical protein